LALDLGSRREPGTADLILHGLHGMENLYRPACVILSKRAQAGIMRTLFKHSFGVYKHFYISAQIC
jgi:hypothetical protein